MIRAELYEDGFTEGYREGATDVTTLAENGTGPAAAAAFRWAADTFANTSTPESAYIDTVLRGWAALADEVPAP